MDRSHKKSTVTEVREREAFLYTPKKTFDRVYAFFFLSFLLFSSLTRNPHFLLAAKRNCKEKKNVEEGIKEAMSHFCLHTSEFGKELFFALIMHEIVTM